MSQTGQGAAGQIRELKVSGHTMALEPGLYCVYNAPGGPTPGPEGLPGVRITAAPGTRRGAIEVTSFAADGWIGIDSAALVHVREPRADLLVTVYQAQDSRSEAPKLQVVLLAPGTPAAASVPDAPPAPQRPPAPQPKPPTGSVEVVAHIYGRGDIAGRLGDWMGEGGSQRWIEGFGIAPPAGIDAADIEYQAVLGRGWLSPWSEGGQFCGSRGMSLPILGMRVRLRGAAAKTHRVLLAAAFVDGTRVGPVADGEPCEAPSLAALEAFQVNLEPKTARPAAAPTTAKPPAAKPQATKPAAAKRTAKAPDPAPEPPRPTRRQKATPAPEPVPEPAKPARRTKAAPAPVPAKPAPRPAPKRTPATTRRR